MTDHPLLAGVVRILKPDGQTAGTGFLVSRDAVVTCAHVLENLDRASVTVVLRGTGERVSGRVVPDSWRPEQDVAVIVLDSAADAAAVRCLPLGSSQGVDGRKDLRAFGFSKINKFKGLWGECEVRGPNTRQGQLEWQLRSEEVTKGFSGGPVWDPALHAVVGMVSRISQPDADPARRNRNTAFMVPVETIREAVPKTIRERMREQRPDRHPYRALEAFTHRDAAYYFGRSRVVDQLLEVLQRHDFAVLVGNSGSGKSSLLRAGLEKKLRPPGHAKHRRGSSGARQHLVFRPDDDPLDSMISAVETGPPDSISPGRVDRSAEARSGAAGIAAAIAALYPRAGLLVAVDQFEQLYTSRHLDEESVGKFIDVLMELPHHDVQVVIALRADFYAQALEDHRLCQWLKEGQLNVPPMDDDELREAIEEPARLQFRAFQPELVTELISEARRQPKGGLPLLELTLTRLWKEDSFTLAAYRQMLSPGASGPGGMPDVIRSTAEDAYRKLESDEETRAAEHVFLRLARMDGGSGTDSPVESYVAHARRVDTFNDADQHVIEKFVAARILLKRSNSVTEAAVVEIAHDQVLASWPRLQNWLRNARLFSQWFQLKIEPRMNNWLEERRNSDLLLPSSMIPEATRWREDPRYAGMLQEDPAKLYLDESIAAEKRRRLRRRIWSVVAIAVVFGLVAGIIQYRAGQQIEQERQRASTARNLLDEAGRKADTDPLLSLRLAAAAVGLDPVASRPQLASVLSTSHYRGSITGVNAYAAQLRPDGRVALLGGRYNEGKLWDLSDPGTPRRLSSLDGPGRFNSDGTLALTITGKNGPSTLWNVRDPSHPRRVLTLPGLGIFTSRDTMLSTTWDSSATKLTTSMWDLPTDGRPHRTRTISGEPAAAMLEGATQRSAHRALLADCCSAPELWSLGRSPRRLATLPRESSDWLALSPDGRTAVASAQDNSGFGHFAAPFVARLWDVASPHSPHKLAVLPKVPAVTHRVTSAAFSADSRTLATISSSGQGVHGRDPAEVAFWDISTPSHPRLKMSLPGMTNKVDLSKDGTTALTIGRDGSVMLWNLTNRSTVPVMATLDEPSHGIGAGASSAGRHTVLVPDGNGPAVVWDTTNPRHPHKLGTIDGPIRATALSPDGRTLLTAGKELTVTIWDLPGGAPPRRLSDLQLRHQQEEVSALAISKDGRHVLTNSAAPPMQWLTDSELWDISDRSRPRPLSNIESSGSGAYAVAFSPDGRQAMITEGVAAVDLFDITDVRHPHLLGAVTGLGATRDHNGAVNLAAFAPSGRTGLTAAADGSAYLWDLATSGNAHRISGLTPLAGTSSSAQISPDGNLLITADAAGTGTIWNISDPSSPRAVAVLGSGRIPITSVAFGTDGKTALTGGPGLPTQMWDTTQLTRIAADPLRTVCSILPSTLTRIEWSQDVPHQPYHDSCAG